MQGEEVHVSQIGPVSTNARRFGADEITFAALLLLSIIGMGVSDFSTQYGLTYWLVMLPLFAAASIFTGWFRARRDGQTVAGIIWRQTFHWGAAALAVYLVYVFERTGRVNDEDAGLVTLLVLALTTFLAGVHFDWRLALLGLVLGAAAAAAALIEQFFWVLLIPAVLVGVVSFYWRK